MEAMTAAPADPNPPSPAQVADRLRFSVTRLARLLRQQSDSELTPTQVTALAAIGRLGPLPLGELAQAEQVSAPTATKVVDRLHAAGLVERTPDPEDRRVTQVSLTPEGERRLRQIRARRTAWLSLRLASLPDDELARLDGALDVLDHLTAPPDPRTPA